MSVSSLEASRVKLQSASRVQSCLCHNYVCLLILHVGGERADSRIGLRARTETETRVEIDARAKDRRQTDRI